MSHAATTPLAGMTPCQEQAFDILQREGNVFLTGAAGTGKSFLLRKYLEGTGLHDFPIVASTGAAAVLVGGRTFHSFFGIGIMEGGLQATVARALRSKKLIQRLNRAQCVIIDEVSMLSGSTLAAAEFITRRVRGRDEPWGGLRIIAVGDFAQLPPIAEHGMHKDWAFLHETWKESDFQPALLSTVVRTQDEQFLTVLNYVRTGTVNEDVSDFLNSRMQELPHNFDATRLYAHRARAEEHNLQRLELLPRSLHTFPTQYNGDTRSIDAVKRSAPIPETLLLKEGALIMMRKNDFSPEMRWVNGTLGHVKHITPEELQIDLLNGEEITVEPEKFTYLNGDGEEMGAAWNFPVTLAWATTIHKAQGASLDRLVVDLSQLWEPGQAYVAISRVRSGAGLFVERWSPRSIMVEPLVTEFYNSLASAMQTYTPRPLFTIRIVNEELTDDGPAKRTVAKHKARRALVVKMIKDEALPEDIATQADMAYDRLIHLLEKMLQEGTQVSLTYLEKTVPDYEAIRSSFENLGLERLKPVYEDLEEQIDYDTIRLVRCIMAAEVN